MQSVGLNPGWFDAIRMLTTAARLERHEVRALIDDLGLTETADGLLRCWPRSFREEFMNELKADERQALTLKFAEIEKTGLNPKELNAKRIELASQVAEEFVGQFFDYKFFLTLAEILSDQTQSVNEMNARNWNVLHMSSQSFARLFALSCLDRGSK